MQFSLKLQEAASILQRNAQAVHCFCNQLESAMRAHTSCTSVYPAAFFLYYELGFTLRLIFIHAINCNLQTETNL